MNFPALTPKSAWLPITPRGVAAFASASTGRLLLVQFFYALLAAVALVWFLRVAWVPPIREAIRHLPDGARIENGLLEWPDESPVMLAEGRFLALAVDMEHTGEAISPAHLQVQFGKRDWQLMSLLGVLDAPAFVNTAYPAKATGPLDRSQLEPWWRAREPFFLFLMGAGLVVYLMISWALLAFLYSLPAWAMGFFANRNLDWRASWRLSGAALMPGALLVSAAIVLYGLRAFDLVKFVFAFGLHLLVGWIYIFVSPLFLPRNPEVPLGEANPFGTKPPPN